MIREDIEGWIKWVNIDSLKNNIGKRNVYIWGAFPQGKNVHDFLIRNNISVTGFVDSNKMGEKFCNKKVTDGVELNRENDFIIIVLYKIRDEIINYLRIKHFQINKDYLYIYKEFTVENTSNFDDGYGNVIIGNIKGMKVNFIGYNNKLLIGDVNLPKSNQLIEINLYNNSSLIIGDNTTFLGAVEISCCDNAMLEIGSQCTIGHNTTFLGGVEISCCNNAMLRIGSQCIIGYNTHIAASDKSVIEIGDKCTFAHDLTMVATEQSNITIKENCLVSYYVNFRSGNGHSLFDLDIKENISKSESIVLNEHVWIGTDCTLLGGCNLGSGSMLGAKSLLDKKTESNKLLVGHPAHVIRSNVDWDIKSNLMYEEWQK